MGKKNTKNLLDDLNQWFDTYIFEKENLNLSINTIEQYKRVFDHFYDFCSYKEEDSDELKIGDIDKKFIWDYFIWKEKKFKKKISPSTKNLHISVLKSFFKYISKNDEKNKKYAKVARKLEDITIKVPIRKPKEIDEDELWKILLYVKELPYTDVNGKKSEIINHRNSLILKILIFTGIRTSELLNLKLSDFISEDEENYSFNVIGKGDKERTSYLKKDTIDKELNFLLSKNLTFVAETKNGNVLDRKNLWDTIKKIYINSGVNKSGIHILRHTFAKSLVSKNVNLKTIQELLGHSDIQTTMIYAKTNEKNKLSALKELY